MELQALYVLHERMLRQATGALPEAAACASRGVLGGANGCLCRLRHPRSAWRCPEGVSAPNPVDSAGPSSGAWTSTI